MAPTDLLYLLFFPIITTLTPRTIAAEVVSLQSTGLYPFSCSDGIKTCGSLLYQHNDLDEEQIATYYHVSSSQISPISNGIKHVFLVLVPCSCEQVNGTVGYFYGTNYTVQQSDTFVNVSGQIYSGQAWEVGGEEGSFVAGDQVEMELLCGCVEDDSQIMVTYTVGQSDTLADIATLLSATISEIESYNKKLSNSESGVS